MSFGDFQVLSGTQNYTGTPFTLRLEMYYPVNTSPFRIDIAPTITGSIIGSSGYLHIDFPDSTAFTYDGGTLSLSLNDIDVSVSARYPTNLTGLFTVTPSVTSAVPEPSTWAMMILGFAGIGFMTYRRRQQFKLN